MSSGLKVTMKTIYRFPSIILMPIFSLWTIGPITLTKSVCSICYTCCCNIHQKLGVSFYLTWINLLLTFASGFAYSSWHWSGGIDTTIFCPCLIIAMIFLILLQFMDKCRGCCCPCLPCCDSYCYPVTQFTYLDVNDMNAIITQDNIELQFLSNRNFLFDDFIFL